MEGVNGKLRFTLLFPSWNQQTISFGDCNESSTDNAEIQQNAIMEGYFLVFNDKDGTPYARWKLPEDAMACNGYYEHERDGFVPVKDFKFK